jgi:hypothetical protein
MRSVGEKRNFCLMLSLPSGQELAQHMGLTPPSKEVQDMESDLINSQWDVLHDFGVYDEVEEAVNWFTEVLEVTMGEDEKPSTRMIDGSKTVLLSYGMALVQKLLENNVIALISPDSFLDWEEEMDYDG